MESHIECVWQSKTKDYLLCRFNTTFKRYRGVLICKDTSLKKDTAHTFPQFWQQSEELEVKCGGSI